MNDFWKSISRIGVKADLTLVESKSIILINSVCSVIWIIAFVSLLINLVLGVYVFVPAFALSLALLLLTYFFNHKGLYFPAKVNAILIIMGLLMYMSFKGAYGSGLEYYFLSLLTLPVIVFRKSVFAFLFFFIILSCLALLKFYAPVPEALTFSVPHKVFYVFNSVCSGLMIILAVTFYKNITAKSEEDLISKNTIIENKNQQLDAFTYSVSHDLKAPLRAIDGYSAILKEDYVSQLSPEAKELFRKIQNNSGHMRNMIDNLLIFSRTARQEMRPQIFSMNELVKEVLDEYQKEIKDKNIQVVVGQLEKVKADRQLIYHVVSNLISNAIKYSAGKENASVEVGFYSDKGNKVFFVKDNGIGFNMKYASKLFVPFQRLHSPKEYEGTGVGLSIVKNIIQRHNGNIWVESEEGKGTTFYFSLP
jgi:signal transduction histidine kinase